MVGDRTSNALYHIAGGAFRDGIDRTAEPPSGSPADASRAARPSGYRRSGRLVVRRAARGDVGVRDPRRELDRALTGDVEAVAPSSTPAYRRVSRRTPRR
jgi:hypothetical protein